MYLAFEKDLNEDDEVRVKREKQSGKNIENVCRDAGKRKELTRKARIRFAIQKNFIGGGKKERNMV